MGAFNTVRLQWRDAKTGQYRDINVQFKYGDTWQHEYEVGDVLLWGGNDIGEPDSKHVVASGYLENPDALPGTPEEFEVHVVGGAIAKVIPDTGRFDFVKARETLSLWSIDERTARATIVSALGAEHALVHEIDAQLTHLPRNEPA
ncbi:MAG: hypothetical protein L0Y44_11735 [Phycisphaerales bacterium]|nr:hypothetical protein [Phycisphaerales bacterium]MCI0677064.1 hypothetical protein [Phycisphaerales bacterium]